MSIVTVSEVLVHDNPAPFTAPLRFEICYESLSALEEDLEWKITYVGSAGDESCDQELESAFVGPVVPGTFRFVLEADPPNADKIPKEDLLGATVVFLSGCYRDEEFVRVGYYVNNENPGMDQPQAGSEGEKLQQTLHETQEQQPQSQEHQHQQQLQEVQEVVGEQGQLGGQLLASVSLDSIEIPKIVRNICADEPRVTKFPIKWDSGLHGAPQASDEAAKTLPGQSSMEFEQEPSPEHVESRSLETSA